MVNIWTQKSLEIANSPGYLDALSEVYVMQVNTERPLPADIVPQVKSAFENRESKKLVKLLLENSEVFPVKDSYVGFLKAKPSAIDENPITIKRIAQRLYDLGSFENMLKEAQRPKETNRQLGHSFKSWSNRLGYGVVSAEEMHASTTGIKILKGADTALAEFASTKLGCRFNKGIDLVAKINSRYVVGEAKFLTTPGGEQDRGFDDASGFIRETSGHADRIAIIDGYVWIRNKPICQKIIDANQNIMSALVLKKFLESMTR